MLGKSAGADDGVRNRDSEEGVAVLPHLGQRRKLTSRELRRVCPVSFGLLQHKSLATGIEPHHHQMQRRVFPMPEKGRHESGSSERPRIRRSGRGSVVLQEGARSVSHLQPFTGNFASTCREFHDRPAGRRLLGAVAEHWAITATCRC